MLLKENFLKIIRVGLNLEMDNILVGNTLNHIILIEKITMVQLYMIGIGGMLYLL
jgi:hypothetical protein